MMLYTIEEIRKRLLNPLPGEKAHLPLSPSGRPKASEEVKNSMLFTESAVGLILFENKNNLDIILTQRSAYNGIHSKQVSFPGGKKEPFESNLLQTAIRETEEEIGLKGNKFQLLGELSPIYIPVSGFRVQPFVLYYPECPIFERQEREVSEIFHFPLPLLFNHKILKRTDVEITGREPMLNVPYFEIQNKVVWGATALILNEFKMLLQE